MEVKETFSLPRELIYQVARMNSRRNTLIIPPSTQNQLVSGSGLNVVWQLPDRSLIDLSTMSIAGQFSVIAQTSSNVSSNVQFVWPCAHQLCSEVRLLVNGGVIASGGLNVYNMLSQQVLLKAQTDTKFRNAHVLEGMETMYIPANASNDTSSQAPVYGDTLTNTQTQSSNKVLVYSNLPVSKTSKFLDTSVFGKSYLQIRSSNNNILKATNIQSRGVQWQWNNLELQVQVISEIPEIYAQTIRELVSQKKQLKMVLGDTITNLYSYNSAINFNVSSSCIDAFFMAPIQPVGTASGLSAYYSDITQMEAPMFQFSWGSSSNFLSSVLLNLRVANYAIPQTGTYQRLYHLAQQTEESLFGDSIYGQNSLYLVSTVVNDSSPPYYVAEYYNEKGYTQQNAVYYQNLSMLKAPGFQNDILSGISSHGIDNVFTLSSSPDSSISTTNMQMLVGIISTSCLIFDSETGSVSVVH